MTDRVSMDTRYTMIHTAHLLRSPTRRITSGMIVLALAATMAACGSDDASDTVASDPPPTPDVSPATDGPPATDAPAATDAGAPGSTDADSAPAGDETLHLLPTADHGDVLASAGFALYIFTPDAGTGGSTCNDDCAGLWPPLLSDGETTAVDGIDADQITSVSRDDGTEQVAYNGWPLYFYAPDQPGQSTGQGLGGNWWLIAADGTPVEDAAAATIQSTGSQSDTGRSDGY